MIRMATAADAAAIAAIYNHYIANTVITFEETPLAPEEIAERMRTVLAAYPWLVLEREGRVQGYAYAGRFHARSAYRPTAETAVYLADGACGAGLGTALYADLLERLRVQGLRSLIGIIALPNEPSVGLHEKFGFAPVARLKEVGRKFDRYIDVGYWQLML